MPFSAGPHKAYPQILLDRADFLVILQHKYLYYESPSVYDVYLW